MVVSSREWMGFSAGQKNDGMRRRRRWQTLWLMMSFVYGYSAIRTRFPSQELWLWGSGVSDEGTSAPAVTKKPEQHLSSWVSGSLPCGRRWHDSWRLTVWAAPSASLRSRSWKTDRVWPQEASTASDWSPASSFWPQQLLFLSQLTINHSML